MILATLLLACGNEPAAPAAAPADGHFQAESVNPSHIPPEVQAVDPMGVYPHQAVEIAPPGAPFLCCDEAAATEALDRYVAMNHAMAYDDLAAAKAEMLKLAAAVKEEMPEASAQFQALAEGGPDLQHLRDKSRGLDSTMVAFARAHTGGTKSYRQAYCPMADRNWIQVGDTLENPYYGAKMRNCGSFR